MCFYLFLKVVTKYCSYGYLTLDQYKYLFDLWKTDKINYCPFPNFSRLKSFQF